jgi:hypothetical protein
MEAFAALRKHGCNQLGCDPKAVLDIRRDNAWLFHPNAKR